MSKKEYFIIEYSTVGPTIIPVPVETVEKDTKEEVDMAQILYTFDEARDVIIKWFEDRILRLKTITQEEYFSKTILTHNDFLEKIEDDL